MFPPEGDRATYYESSQSTIKRNTESIRRLRQENKKLYKKLAEANAVSPHKVEASVPPLLLLFFLSSRIFSQSIIPDFLHKPKSCSLLVSSLPGR